MRRSDSHRALLLAFCLLLTATVALTASAGKKKAPEPDSTPVPAWLVLGPVAHPLPLFHDAAEGGYDVAKLLEEQTFSGEPMTPIEGARVAWYAGPPLRWTLLETGRRGNVDLDPLDGTLEDLPAMALLATYLHTKRWVEVDLRLTGAEPCVAHLDHVKVATCAETVERPKKVQLAPGTHLLVLRAVRDPGSEDEWSAGASFASAEGAQPPPVTFSLDGARTVELRDILDPPAFSSVAVSPDGRKIVASVRRILPGTDDSESWIELRDASTGELERRIWQESVAVASVAWSPRGRYFSYLASPAGATGTSLHLVEPATGKTTALLDDVERLASYEWSPDERTIAYATTVKAEKDERGVQRLQGIMDRWAGFRDKQYIHLITVPGGVRRRLTAGETSSGFLAFSPDGSRLLFQRTFEDLTDRPYTRQEVWQLDLESFDSRKLRDFKWFNAASYSPDGKRLLVLAGPGAFDGEGANLPPDTIPNNYDGQLFVWDPDSGDVEAITREFDPAVGDAVWSPHDGRIYLQAVDGDSKRLFRHDPGSQSFDRLRTGFDVVERFHVARDAGVIVALGNSPWVPQRLVVLNPGSGGVRRLEHPADPWFASVTPGTMEPWSFTASTGREIDGRIYFPPAYDSGKKYPAIVYYYGGTSPVGRDFGGRYPKEWWAANGYVVYVLQPSGATGYGQEASALHVNDWGETTAQEIIEGTRKFLEAHPNVDPDRVGCIGASYGGFMTMLLATKTDLFAAAVSHAGISSLASYWGEGYWGYSYSAIATAESFPWNRKDIYVERSPLFRADRAKVPILLTHGRGDTNVPVGESDAFYVALKLLGLPVEYVQVEGQDHWIMDHAKRTVWSSTIVAWFDRWLKDETGWWYALYPDSKPAEPAAGEDD